MSRDATPALVKSMAAAIINGGSTVKPTSRGTEERLDDLATYSSNALGIREMAPNEDAR
jgi:hypothetical protein